MGTPKKIESPGRSACLPLKSRVDSRQHVAALNLQVDAK